MIPAVPALTGLLSDDPCCPVWHGVRTHARVTVCDRNGKTRNASVGRCKVEVRPLLIVTATDGKKMYNVVLQNAETIKVVTPKGAESVTKLKKGDKVLAHLATGGRHFGMKIEETITEK